MNIFIKYLIIINNLYLLNAVNLLVSFTYDIHVNLILNDHHLTFESECCLHYYKYQIIWNYLLCGIVYYYWQGHLSVKYIWYAAGYFLAIGFSIAKSKQPSKIIKLSISSSLPHLISVSNTNFMRSWSDVDKKREVNVSQTGFLIRFIFFSLSFQTIHIALIQCLSRRLPLRFFDLLFLCLRLTLFSSLLLLSIRSQRKPFAPSFSGRSASLWSR